jgi:hypothetical protein
VAPIRPRRGLWIGFGMNALLLIGFISLLIGVVHGDFSLFFG